MPGGRNSITGTDGNTFSRENQPKNRRKSTKFLTDLLTKNLRTKKEITIDVIDIVTGKQVKGKILMPTKDVIVQALLRQAAKGNTIAIGMIWDRLEGKVSLPVEMTGDGVTTIRIIRDKEL